MKATNVEYFEAFIKINKRNSYMNKRGGKRRKLFDAFIKIKEILISIKEYKSHGASKYSRLL